MGRTSIAAMRTLPKILAVLALHGAVATFAVAVTDASPSRTARSNMATGTLTILVDTTSLHVGDAVPFAWTAEGVHGNQFVIARLKATQGAEIVQHQTMSPLPDGSGFTLAQEGTPWSDLGGEADVEISLELWGSKGGTSSMISVLAGPIAFHALA